MKEVKKEIFGSRKSFLTQHFIDNNIDFIKNIWFVTCRRAINSDINTRYLVFYENENDVDLDIFKDYIPVYRILFHDEQIEAENIRTRAIKTFSTKEEFKNWIIGKTCCRYIASSASGSQDSTDLSVFFRENMGKGFSLSDVDFLITKKSVFLEEKNFIQNNKGYLGQGQYYTFLEIKNDICNNIPFFIVLSNKENYYLVNFSSLNTSRFQILDRWGKMFEFDLGEKMIIEDIINKFV